MENIHRRAFLKKTGKCTLGLLTLAVVPLGLSGCNTRERQLDTSSMISLGELEELKKGPFPNKVDYKVRIKDAWTEQERSGFVYVVLDDSGDLLIMSPICTHLGCNVTLANEEKQNDGIIFFCPCHDGEYDMQGINVGGPPPRPFDVFETHIEDGKVYISIFNTIQRKG